MIRAFTCSLAAAFLLLGATQVHGCLAWVVATPLVLACAPGCSRYRAVAIGVLFGVTVALTGDARWVAAAGERYFGLPVWGAIAAAAALAVVFGGSFGAVLGVAARGALTLPRTWPVMVFPAVWVGWEAAMLALMPHYPWASLASTQTVTPAMLQVASVLGQWGLTFAIVASGTAFGVALRSRGGAPRATAGTVALGVGIAVAVAAVGWMRATPAAVPATGECSVAAVDASIEAGDAAGDDVMQRYGALTQEALAGGATRVVWPESAIPGFPETDVGLQRALRRVVAEGRATLLAGGPRADWTSDWTQRLFNSVYQIDAAGPLPSYDKRRLVPFAEYWPRGLGPRPSWLATDDVTSGVRAGMFRIGGCQLGVLLCFEVEEPALARELAMRGADVLVVLSNDAQLPPAAIRKEVMQAQLRAVETGLPIVRVANRGTSAAIDRYGYIRQVGTGGVLFARAPAGRAAAAVHWAPVFNAACWIGAALATVLGMRR